MIPLGGAHRCRLPSPQREWRPPLRGGNPGLQRIRLLSRENTSVCFFIPGRGKIWDYSSLLVQYFLFCRLLRSKASFQSCWTGQEVMMLDGEHGGKTLKPKVAKFETNPQRCSVLTSGGFTARSGPFIRQYNIASSDRFATPAHKPHQKRLLTPGIRLTSPE